MLKKKHRGGKTKTTVGPIFVARVPYIVFNRTLYPITHTGAITIVVTMTITVVVYITAAVHIQLILSISYMCVRVYTGK